MTNSSSEVGKVPESLLERIQAALAELDPTDQIELIDELEKRALKRVNSSSKD